MSDFVVHDMQVRIVAEPCGRWAVHVLGGRDEYTDYCRNADDAARHAGEQILQILRESRRRGRPVLLAPVRAATGQ